MSRSDLARLDDITVAVERIHSHLERGPLTDGLVLDAVRMRLVEIGEAVKALPEQLLAKEPSLPWRDIGGMRDFLAHRYFDTDTTVIAATIDRDLPRLEAAVARIRAGAGRSD